MKPIKKLPAERVLGRSRMLAFLDTLKDVPGVESQAIYLPPNVPPDNLSFIERLAQLPSIALDLNQKITNSPNGAVIFWGPSRKLVVIPPFPVKEQISLPGYDVQPLYRMLKKDYYIGLVLIRLGAYAAGLCKGTELISSKVGTGLVHARHRQGGSSAHRFERHRDKQIETFLTRVCGHVREQLEPMSKSIDFLVYGGALTTIQSLKEQCPFLNRFEIRELPPLLTIHEPRRAELESAVEKVWSSRVTEYGLTG